MLKRLDLKKIARGRLKDAEVLLNSSRYDGAVYICGYAIELSLKARICKVLHWAEYPSTRKEFESFQSFKTHNLDVLLRLTGLEENIKTNLLAEWSVLAEWDPEVRYKPIGNLTKEDAELMIESAKTLLRVL
jgi:HEPN domain-containing protein